MKFLYISVAAVILVWVGGFYPVWKYLGEEHLRGFFLGSGLGLAGNVVSYLVFRWSYVSGTPSINAVLAGSVIRMGIILGALLIVSTTKWDLAIVALWALGFYFAFLFCESFYLMKEVQKNADS